MEMKVAIQALELLERMAERAKDRDRALEEVGLYTEGIYSDFDDYANFVGNALEDSANVISAWINIIWAEDKPVLQYADMLYPMETAEDVYNLIVKFRNIEDADFCY